jgi:hypothetical protein
VGGLRPPLLEAAEADYSGAVAGAGAARAAGGRRIDEAIRDSCAAADGGQNPRKSGDMEKNGRHRRIIPSNSLRRATADGIPLSRPSAGQNASLFEGMPSAILERIRTLRPDRFTKKHARLVQGAAMAGGARTPADRREHHHDWRRQRFGLQLEATAARAERPQVPLWTSGTIRSADERQAR